MDTAETAVLQHAKKQKQAAPEGAAVFDNKTLYAAYEKRTEKVREI